MKSVRRKLIGLGLRFSNHFKFSYIPFSPLHLDIEPINICNFKCNYCKVTYWNKDKEELNLQNFIKILDQFPHLKSVKLQGLGEPLLNKEFSKLVVECRKRDIYLEFFTNGSIYKQEVWDTINETKKVNVIFSIDAATKEKFERIRIKSNFEKIISNIEKIIKNNEQKYSFWTVVNKENLTELSEIILLAKQLGIPKVTFQTFLSDWKNTEVQKFNQTISFDKKFDELKRTIKKAQGIAKKYEIKLDVYKGNFLSKENKCVWPFTSAFIASNGDVVPCCVISDSDVISMGNVFQTPFKQIWNSKKYIDFRKSIKHHQLNDFCKSCYGEN